EGAIDSIAASSSNPPCRANTSTATNIAADHATRPISSCLTVRRRDRQHRRQFIESPLPRQHQHGHEYRRRPRDK
ncbi:hypothetical protein CTI14_70330, partial [Methylobacterium radiotolerans]